MKERLTAEDIIKLSENQKAVRVPSASIPRMPAAFMASMQFRIVMRYIDMGCYEYEPKKKE